MSLSIWDTLSQYKPKSLYIEETVVVRNPQVQRFLTRLQGVVYAWCMENGCEFTAIRPTSWRKAVGISSGHKKRAELKAIAIQMVHNLYNIDVTDDVAEAILIGRAAINLYAA